MSKGLRGPVWATSALMLVALSGCEQTAVNVLPVAVVDVSPSQLSIVQGDHETLSATPRTSDGRALAGRSVEWSSDDPGIAAVDAQGEVEGVGPGDTQVQATADGVTGSAALTVLPGRRIVVSTADLQIEGISGESTPVRREVAVTNGGAGTLSGLEAAVVAVGGGPTEWLEATLDATTAPTSLRLRAHAEGLEPGTYEARVTLSAPRALNSPVHLDVTLAAREPDPVLALDPVSISLSAQARSHEPATQTVVVLNTGGGLLSGLTTSVQYTGGGAVEWLSTELKGTVAPTELTLSASARNLQAGSYSAVVRVSSPLALNDFAEVSVSFTVGGNLSLGGTQPGRNSMANVALREASR